MYRGLSLLPYLLDAFAMPLRDILVNDAVAIIVESGAPGVLGRALPPGSPRAHSDRATIHHHVTYGEEWETT